MQTFPSDSLFHLGIIVIDLSIFCLFIEYKHLHQIFLQEVGIFFFMTDQSPISPLHRLQIFLSSSSSGFGYILFHDTLICLNIECEYFHQVVHWNVNTFSFVIELYPICLHIEYIHSHQIVHWDANTFYFVIDLYLVCLCIEWEYFYQGLIQDAGIFFFKINMSPIYHLLLTGFCQFEFVYIVTIWALFFFSA